MATPRPSANPHPAPTSPSSTSKTPSSPPLPRPSDRPPPAQEDADGWARVLARYQDGSAALDMASAPLNKPFDLVYDPSDRAAEEKLEGLSLGPVEYAQAFYRARGHLPAIYCDSHLEEEREETLRRYSLHQAHNFRAVDDIARMAKDNFSCDSVLVNVVSKDRVRTLASAGWDPSERDREAAALYSDLNVSFCPHAVGKGPEQGCFMMNDVASDWRFRRSPLVRNGLGPVQFFASANINLTHPLHKDKRIPIGSFCLMGSKPREPMSDSELRTLKSMADLAAREFELVFERERNKLFEARNQYTTSLFHSQLVYASRMHAPIEERSLAVTEDLVNLVARSDWSAILDLQNFRIASSASPTSPASPNLTTRASTRGALHDQGTISVMDLFPKDEDDLQGLKEKLEDVVSQKAVVEALAVYQSNRKKNFAGLEAQGHPLLSLLPAGTTAFIASPVFNHEGEPSLLVLISSTEPHHIFESVDETFVSGVGGVVMAALLKDKILAADQAKLSFVSTVSHEMRTPLFSIAGSLQLVRDVGTPDALAPLATFLDTAEVSLAMLKDVLDDCLEYSKLSNQDMHGAALAPKLQTVELEKLVVDIMKGCQHRAGRSAALQDDVSKHDVAFLFESSVSGLVVQVDVGGLSRVLMNLIGNALKFTVRGSITVRITEAEAPSSPSSPAPATRASYFPSPSPAKETSSPSPSCPSTKFVRFEVIDTGVGMSTAFIRDSLGVAFKQVDSFANGAGLGVSLASQLVRRMRGTMSYTSSQEASSTGTTATVVLPLEVVEPTTGEDCHRNLSAELAQSVASCSPTITPSSSSPPRRPVPAPPPACSPPNLRNTPVSPLAPTRFVVPATSAPSLTPPTQESPPPLQTRVLVIDDNFVARRLLTTWLKTKKIEYAEAADGVEAVEAFKRFRPTVCWSDLQMPRMDGLEATRLMREVERKDDWPPARIIMLSGLDSTIGGHDEMLKTGQVNRWMVKGGKSLQMLSADLVEHEQRLLSGALANVDLDRSPSNKPAEQDVASDGTSSATCDGA
ncbi:hypothetical protein JCM8547_002145 [Rhodosporidiobolus lusitaniae]